MISKASDLTKKS
jgi:hypothetical protein